MAATPCPGTAGCHCPYCYGLAEYATEHLGKGYGLPRTWQPPPRLITPPEPVDAPVRLARPSMVPQPWEVRPSRRSLRMAA